jgi:hypothetical protein
MDCDFNTKHMESQEEFKENFAKIKDIVLHTEK